MLNRIGAALVLAGALASSACATTPEGTYAFSPRACTFQGASGDALCGSVSVPEDYTNPNGRRIALNVIWLRATEPQTPRRAVFFFEGGPGFGITDAVGFLADYAALRRHNDIVLTDMRGTGGSNALYCTALHARRDNRNLPLYPPELVAECATEVSAHADPRHYITANAAHDVDAVRQALGFGKIDVSGGSFGSTLGLAYIALYPENVRAAHFLGVAPSSAMPPRAHSVGAQRALLMYIDVCAAEAACAAAFPDLRGDLERVRANLADNDPVSFEIFMERMRERMYAPGGGRGLPLVIHRAAQNDFDGFMAPPPGGAGRVLADGLYLSITCAESFPHFDYEDAARLGNQGYFGDYRLRRQRAACAEWEMPAVRTPEPREPTNVPVLFVAGDLDPVTPPHWAEEAQRAFPNSRLIVVPDGGHGWGGLTNLDCMQAIEVAFHDNADPASVDASCITDVRRPPFQLE